MNSKSSVVFLVIAMLAQVSTVCGTESDTRNSTWTPSFGATTLDRPCLSPRMLAQVFAALVVLKDERGCRECKEEALSTNPFFDDIPHCAGLVEPYCEAIHKCREVCGEMSLYIIHEIFRCTMLQSLSNVYEERVRSIQDRFLRLGMVPEENDSPETLRKLNALTSFFEVDPVCPLDCRELLFDGEDVESMRENDKSMFDSMLSHFEQKEVFATSEPHISRPISDGPCLNDLHMAINFANCVLSKKHSEESLIQMAFCLACGLEHRDFLDQAEKEIAPFCKPLPACSYCGNCRQHLDCMIVCAVGDQECPVTCDEPSSE